VRERDTAHAAALLQAPHYTAEAAYKRLAQVERAFRSLKSVDLKVRPIHHRLEDRVRAHILLCMLAYYVEWHMRQALAPCCSMTTIRPRLRPSVAHQWSRLNARPELSIKPAPNSPSMAARSVASARGCAISRRGQKSHSA
jgi:hypothetical protein